MRKIHQICPVCAACNTKKKDGYYMCCGCRHKWKDVKSLSVFDKITESVETLAEVSVCKLDEGVYYSHMIGSFYSTHAKAYTATVEELKKEYNKK